MAAIERSTRARNATRAKLLDAFGADYLERIGEVAERLRERFERGELRGYRTQDFESGVRHLSPPLILEREVTRRLRLWLLREAALVVAASPSTCLPADTGPASREDGSPLRIMAEELASWDVLRIARRRGWYKPTPDEEPSDAQLGGAPSPPRTARRAAQQEKRS